MTGRILVIKNVLEVWIDRTVKKEDLLILVVVFEVL